MDRKLIAILVAGLAVMGITVWIAYPSGPPPIPKKDRLFMYCPACEKETRYDERRSEGDCSYCGRKGPLIATKESIRKTGLPPSPLARLLPPLIVEVTILAAVVFWYASRRLRQVQEEDNDLYMSCERCHSRLRFREERIGRVGQCPRCKHRFVFPAPDPDEDVTPLHWWQPRWWQSGQWRKMFQKTA